MVVWLKRIVRSIFLAFAIVIVAVVGLLNFGPISSPMMLVQEVLGLTIDSPEAATVQQRLHVPDGFSVNKFANGLGKIRFMSFTSGGDLLVSQSREGQILLLERDADADGVHNGKQVLLSGLTRPHGIVLHGEYLYVGESNAVGRIGFDHKKGMVRGDYQRIITGLPDSGGHWSKSLLIHNDSLFVSIGSSCNVCEEKDPRRATIMRFKLDGSGGEIYATGLRNSVGMDVAPWNGEIFATDNGRDLLGDDYPVCELNNIVEGGFYGWPYINAFADLDPDLGGGKEALLNSARSPAYGFPAHNAPLGIRFLRSAKMPAGFERSALVALHGSWNRSKPDGYKVVSLHWQDDGAISTKDFLSGFEEAGSIIGRPVDIAEGPDACVYISDDYSGTIYRMCYQ